eukprot:scaffold230930_cov33-Tisochrysis_lutea.AAC.11
MACASRKLRRKMDSAAVGSGGRAHHDWHESPPLKGRPRIDKLLVRLWASDVEHAPSRDDHAV